MTTDEWIIEAHKVANLLNAAADDPQPMRLHFEDCWRVVGHSSCLHAKSADMITGILTELAFSRAREATLREVAQALRIDANRLCDRNLGGTYEEDCRRSIAALDAALAEGEPHA